MKTFACLFAAALVVSLSAGCSSDRDVSYKSITSDLTPELKGTSTTEPEAHNAYSIANNQNLRGFWDDLGRFWLTDNPSHLSPYPITDVSGQPR